MTVPDEVDDPEKWVFYCPECEMTVKNPPSPLTSCSDGHEKAWVGCSPPEVPYSE